MDFAIDKSLSRLLNGGLVDQSRDAADPILHILCDNVLCSDISYTFEAVSGLQAELDKMCEDFLSERHDCRVDFAIDESLPRLLNDGLVEQSGDAADPRLHAAPLEVAHERLVKKWQTCATALFFLRLLLDTFI